MHLLGVIGTWPVQYDWLYALGYPPLVAILSASIVVAAILFLPAPTLSLAIVGGLVASLPVYLWTVPAYMDDVGSWLVRSVIAGFIGLVLGGLAGRVVARHRAIRRDRGSQPAVGALAVGFAVVLVVVTCMLLFGWDQSRESINVALWSAWGATLGMVVGGLLGSAWSDPTEGSRTMLRRVAVAFALVGVAAIFVAEATWKRTCGTLGNPSGCYHLKTTFMRGLIVAAFLGGLLVVLVRRARSKVEAAELHADPGRRR